MSERTVTDVEHVINERPEQQAISGVLNDLKSLEYRVEVAEQVRDEYQALNQRTRVDFDNYQKRVQRDMAEERRYAAAALARELLPILDNLQRALDAAMQFGDRGPFVQGVTMAHSQFLDVLRGFGITVIDAMGRVFDPCWHEAVIQQQRPDVASGTIVQVLEAGYQIHDRVLRPARVIVAA
jgi:molecular chaperone GrpE